MDNDTPRFLNIICGSSLATFQTFDDNKDREKKGLARVIHGNTEATLAELKALSEQGAGVFLMVNQGDGKGRTGNNVTCVRAVFVDLDGASVEPVRRFDPHLVVESSPGRYHAYWLVIDFPIEMFTPFQKALAKKFAGDPNVHDLSRVMRLPGFLHRKGTPFLTRIFHEANDIKPYRLEDLKRKLELDLNIHETKLNLKQATTTPVIPLDGDTAIAMATTYLTTVDPAVEGQGGDTHTFRTACRVKDFGVSEDEAFLLMAEHFNPRCLPPWEDDDLAKKVNSAYRYGLQPPGINNPEAVFTVWEDPDPPTAIPKTEDRLSTLFVDGHDLIRRDLKINYLIDGFIETPTTGLIFGDSTAGKSFIAIDMSMSVVFAHPWMGAPSHAGRVLYFNGEGYVGFARRLQAWLRYYNYEDLPRGAFTTTSRRVELTEKSIMQLEPLIKADISKYGPIAMINIDTLARHIAAGLDENKATDIGTYMNAMGYLCERYNAVVTTIHHSGKVNKDISRGSSAIRAALEWEMKVSPGEIRFMKQKEGDVPAPFGFALQKVVLSDLASSAVPILCQYDPTHGKAKLSGDALKAFSILQMGISNGGGTLLSRAVWRQQFMDVLRADLKAITKRQKFLRAEEALVQAGTVKIEGGNVYDCTISEEDSCI